MIITRFRGDTYRLRLLVKDSETGVPLDLASMTAQLSVSSVENPAAPPDIFSVSGAIVTPATSGQIDFVPPSNTAAGNYWYDVQVTDGSGQVRTLVKGEYRIVQDVTK